ncbi:MAG: phosphatidate cytidylyltransferase [Acidimicrobiia bacterium]|nr:phosphatidate cytidylyltransferase [Acidimicrobiia bacterium]
MSDNNDGVEGVQRRSRSEQLRIVGAEEARRAVADDSDDGLVAFPRRRSVFDQIPDAPSSFLDDFFDSDPSDEPASSTADDDSDPNHFGSVPVIRVANPTPDESQELELPHWTAPATGQVPSVLAPEDSTGEQWSTYGASPRWRDQSTDWEADDYADVSDLGDSEAKLGALADRERPAIDDFFDFDDNDSEAVERVAVSPAGSRRGGESPKPRSAASARVTSLNERRGDGAGRDAGRRPPGATERNVPLAIAVGAGLGVAALLLLKIGPAAMMLLVSAVVAIGAAEFFQTARKAGHHPATLVGLGAAALLPAAVYWRGPAAVPLVMFLAVVFSLMWYLFGVDTEEPATGAAMTLLGVAYVGGLASFAALLLRAGSPRGTDLLLAAIIPTVAADVVAYVVGRNAGKSPLSPASPNKTVEGLLGGIAGAIIGSVLINGQLLGLVTGFRNALALGLAVAVAAPLGDLCESLLKRGFGVKDMGTTIPGHGGVLDRFDALLFVLPTAYYVYLLLDLLP